MHIVVFSLDAICLVSFLPFRFSEITLYLEVIFLKLFLEVIYIFFLYIRDALNCAKNVHFKKDVI